MSLLFAGIRETIVKVLFDTTCKTRKHFNRMRTPSRGGVPGIPSPGRDLGSGIPTPIPRRDIDGTRNTQPHPPTPRE